MMSMPPFCAAKFNLPQGSPEWNAWRDRIGQNFIDIHHYCFALVAVKRYWGARTKQDRGFYLQRALNNLRLHREGGQAGFCVACRGAFRPWRVVQTHGQARRGCQGFQSGLGHQPQTPQALSAIG
jgi:hypothetical protein